MTPSTRALADIRDRAVRIAREGAALVLSGYRSGLVIEKKGTIDLVTRYDRECELLVRARLAEAFPDHAIVGEEGDSTGSSELVWYVDPIDGTTNFAHGHPFFCVSLGLFHRAAPLASVIAAPALGIEWSAHAGGGATRNGTPMQVSATDTLEDALLATGFAYDRWRAVDDNLGEHDHFVKATRGVRRCGAAALDLAMVADGTYDGYWEQSLGPWDIAAGLVLVTEAGGRVTDYLGRPTSPLAGQVVATNGPLHAAVLDGIAHARGLRGHAPEGIRKPDPFTP